nr:aldehyde dehydrogenase family 7 member B4 isoform X2 [Ipomoea batatas]GMD32266.1 aldehyde dehydrogenase family 7 member B4 isoform X2 [Ipomoea batatas]GMD33713.1 aldehyde dehydrogenase family 7 member B4 isoform X2 [Ipomoea batatas]GMD35443.1 aldehyde dehydrogenase family 7 member B4 isoform X2 [Ipomoea batatas]GMD37153.1 aldehyde dehydrogenase family 7 member B4 isoform X2 [Ipomoea batatas]
MKKACRLVTKQQSCGCRFQHQKEVILLGRLVMHLEQNFTTLADLFHLKWGKYYPKELGRFKKLLTCVTSLLV